MSRENAHCRLIGREYDVTTRRWISVWQVDSEEYLPNVTDKDYGSMAATSDLKSIWNVSNAGTWVTVNQSDPLKSIYGNEAIIDNDGVNTLAIKNASEYKLNNVSQLKVEFPIGDFESYIRFDTSEGTIGRYDVGNDGAYDVEFPDSAVMVGDYYYGYNNFGKDNISWGETWEFTVKDGYVRAEKIYSKTRVFIGNGGASRFAKCVYDEKEITGETNEGEYYIGCIPSGKTLTFTFEVDLAENEIETGHYGFIAVKRLDYVVNRRPSDDDYHEEADGWYGSWKGKDNGVWLNSNQYTVREYSENGKDKVDVTVVTDNRDLYVVASYTDDTVRDDGEEEEE